MTRFTTVDLRVCTVCIHLLANGEFNDGEDTAERCAAGMVKVWGDDVKFLVPGDGDHGYVMADCEGCGDPYHGDRFVAHLVKPSNAHSLEGS